MPKEDYKRCPRCGITKPRGDFYHDCNRQNGFSSYCRACHNERLRQHPKRQKKAARKWSENNPEKIRAQAAVHNALARGKLTKPEHCESCGRSLPKARLDGHHEDYSKPLDVDWLCRQCHVDRHKSAPLRLSKSPV